jgi:hypothetical protein
METIKNLLIMKMKEYEDKKDNVLGDAALARDFSSDDLIEGLCLLHCLKNEEIKANFEKGQNRELAEKSAKKVLKAAKTIRSFQNAQGDDQYLQNTKKTADMQLLTKPRGNGTEATVATPGSENGADAEKK